MTLEPGTNHTPDRSLLLPILLAVFSLCGILMVFVIGRVTAARNALPPENTATPFKYQLIGTEPGVSTAEPLTEEPVLSDTPFSDFGPTTPMDFLNTAIPSTTPIFFFTPTSNIPFINTATSTSVVTNQLALAPGTYDDSHPLLTFNGWSSVTDTSAYQNTLHVSNIAGSTVTFKFTGQQFSLKFQGAASFGVIRINIGGLDFDLSEANGNNEWISARLAQGTYTVTITHTAGGSVNIDSIVIPDFNTPTPTATATSTSNGQ